MNIKKTAILLLIPLLFVYCQRNPLKVDLSGIDRDPEIIRFDEKLFNLPLNDTLQELTDLRNEHPRFFDLFTWRVIGVGGIEEEDFLALMGRFLTDSMVVDVRHMVDSQFSHFDDIQESLTEAFKYYQYHFPEKPLPTIYTMISGFNQSVVTAEEIIGISLDKYLGSDCPYYSRLSNVPHYKVRNMHRKKMVSDVAYAWGLTEFEEDGSATTLLDQIIYQGKIMYFVDALLPEMHDSLKIGYSAKHLEWCKKNEAQMWNYLVEKKMLYSNKRMDIMRFINDGPYTTNFPLESPARTGIWIGWQIVRQYMKNSKEITIAELMKNTDYQQILNSARYFPD